MDHGWNEQRLSDLQRRRLTRSRRPRERHVPGTPVGACPSAAQSSWRVLQAHRAPRHVRRAAGRRRSGRRQREGGRRQIGRAPASREPRQRIADRRQRHGLAAAVSAAFLALTRQLAPSGASWRLRPDVLGVAALSRVHQSSILDTTGVLPRPRQPSRAPASINVGRWLVDDLPRGCCWALVRRRHGHGEQRKASCLPQRAAPARRPSFDRNIADLPDDDKRRQLLRRNTGRCGPTALCALTANSAAPHARPSCCDRRAFKRAQH